MDPQDKDSSSENSESNDTTPSVSSSEASHMNPIAANPFKKSPQDDNWGKEATLEHRPILAPPRLRAPSDTSSPSSSNSLRGTNSFSPGGGGMLGMSSGGSVFTTPPFSSNSPSNKPVFKLKPSMLTGFASPSAASSLTASTPFGSLKKGEGSSPAAKNPSSNPFAIAPSEKEESDTDNSNTQNEAKPADESSHRAEEKEKKESEECSAEKSPAIYTNEHTLTSPSSDASSPPTRPAFVPLTHSNESPSSEDSAKVNGLSASSSSLSRVSGGFIFGQNLHNRVSGIDESGSSGSVFGSVGTTANGEMPSGGSTGNLFTEAATGLTPQGASSPEEGGACGGKTLVESSRELSEKEAREKRKYEEVEIITGEENESNVLQMMCKLYWFSLGSWQERGRGHLRLNDRKIDGEIHSRLVIRTQGTFTVMLNAKIWAEMSIEKSNDKSVRFTATDADGQPKIFLVMGTPKDIDLLYTSLEYRVAESKSQKLPSTSDSLEQENKKLKPGSDAPLST